MVGAEQGKIRKYNMPTYKEEHGRRLGLLYIYLLLVLDGGKKSKITPIKV